MLYSPVVSLALSLFITVTTILGMVHGMWEGCDWVMGFVLAAALLGCTIDSIVNGE